MSILNKNIGSNMKIQNKYERLMGDFRDSENLENILL